MRKIISAVLICLIVMPGTFAAYAYTDEPAGLYSLVSAGRYDRFTNNAAGYSLHVDKGMIADMSYSSVAAVLENESKRIEIYKQNISSTGRMAYINYSNRFLENEADHYLAYSEDQMIGGYDVHVTEWSRDKLSGIENDKNYYACLELGFGNYAYTIFVKANAPLYELGGFEYLIENFSITAATAPGYIRASAPVDIDGRGWNNETKAFYNTYFSDEAGLTWGIFAPDTALFDYSKLKWYEEYFDYKFPIILNYSEFENTYQHPNLKQRLEAAHSNGKILELTLQTPRIPMPDGSNVVYKILDGRYDRFLMNYAQAIADFGRPVLFRLGNEMNGDWCLYSAYNTSKDTVIFKEFYKYVYGFFEKAGANKNTIWVWNPNGKSYPDFKWNDELMYYPGDEYVDIVGMTMYNTGTYYYDTGERWQEFRQLYDDLYKDYCAKYSQPFMITEFASASLGGDKEQWVINMFEDIDMYPGIKAAIWWDGCDWDAEGNIARSYFMDETPGLLEIFKRNLKPDWRKRVFG